MTRSSLLIIAGLAAIAGASLLFVSRDAPLPTGGALPQPSSTERAAAPLTASTMDGFAQPASGSPASSTPAAIRVRPPDPMAANFAATDDLLAFVEGIHPTAEAGDGAAAYYMFRALDRCQTEYGMRFGGGRRERPFDDVLADPSVVSQFGEADLRRIYGQCQRLRESDLARLGPMDDWLLKAADARYPRAQAELALQLVNGTTGTQDPEALEKARELARAALESRDPAVFVPVSSVIGRLTEGNADRDASWFVAACQRGFDCSPGSEMTRIVCRFDTNCQPYESSLDLLRRHSGNDFDAIERGAREINAAIDAGRFDELGL
jgi:hypothetical protein